MAESKPRRVLLKLSGELLGGASGSCLDLDALTMVCQQILRASSTVQIAIVVGAGNILRGSDWAKQRVHPTDADAIGMVATHVNALALCAHLRSGGQNCVVMGPHSSVPQVQLFESGCARAHLARHEIVLLAGGTGNPFFTTDSCAALRAAELDVDELLKGTKHDGIFDSDPAKSPDANKFDHITFDEVLSRGLAAMDSTAFTLCREQNIPLTIFDMKRPDSIFDAIMGNPVGSRISS
ncbi:MAG TPA: uridine monophosphate kinase [Planctomycetes bacterium]|nr:uridine monophosphate kinase [Planctomycetota bacterium]